MKSKRFVAFAAAFSLAVSSFAGITMNAFAADETITYDFSKVTQANGFAKANTLTGSQEGFIGLTCGGVDQLASDSQSFIKLSKSNSDSQYIEFTANDTFTLVCSSAASNGSKGTLVTNTGTGVKYTTTATSTPLTLSGLAAGTYRISGTPAGSYYDVSKSMTELTSVSANAAYIGTITISYGGSAVVPEQPTTAPGATTAPAATPQATVDPDATSEVSITRAAGWMESAYITWTNPVAVDSYNVYVRPEGGAYTKLDKELTRYYGSYYRADALGLAAGSYQFKVEAVLGGSVKETVESDVVTVSAYKREGFAFDSHSSHYNKDGVGAYKNDGTLKDGAQVLYITDKNKDTVTMDVVVDTGKGKTETGTGLVEILSLREKNNAENTPLAIRMIGQVEAPAGVNGSKYAQIKATSNITFEGVGDDATTYHWSLLIRDTNNIEVRNLAVMEFYDDGISLDTDNYNDWVHNCDIFYGQNRGGDQKKGDGSLDVKAGSDYCTFSYNHFWDSGKTSLCGMKEDSYKGYHMTYNYNWFDHSDSRHPRVRGDQVHVYNNYYDGVSKYGVGACTGGSVFVENNVFRNCVHPVLTSMQGRDIEGGKGTFSSEDGGSIKMFGNTIYGGVSVWYSSKNNVSSDTDAYLAETRDETVPSTYVAKQGGAAYTNFDTASTMYSYSVLDTDKVVDYVQAHAGRVQGGDFTHEFNDAVDDALYDRDEVLGNALQSYKTTLKTEYTAAAAYPATEGTQPSEKPTPAPFDPSAQPTSAPEGGGSSTEEVTSIWRASDNGAGISAGAVLKADWLKLIGNGVDYKASNQTIGGVGFSGKVNAPSGQTAPTLAENGQNGAALQFIPDKDGKIKVYFKLNSGKTFYITDDKTTVIASHENTSSSSEYTTLSAYVKADNVYFAFADGSNAEYWAAEYSYTSDYVDDDPEETPAPDVTQAPATTAPAETGAPATQAPPTPAPETTEVPSQEPATQAPVVTAEPVDPSGYVTPATSVDVPKTWSADSFTIGTYTAPLEKDGLYIGAGAGVDETDPTKLTEQVVVDANSKKIGKASYTQRIKSGGSGDPETGIRVFYFKTNGDCDILLHASSSNNDDTRDVAVIHGSTVEHVNVLAAEEYRVNDIKAGETVYIYSTGGGLNVYGIQLVEQGAGILDQKQLPFNTRITFDAFAGTAITETCLLGDYVKVIYTDGTPPVIDNGNKTIGGYTYSKRLKLGGKVGMGSTVPTTKAISVIPASDGTLYVDFGSPSGGAARTLTVAQGSNKATGDANSEGAQMSLVVKAGEEVFIYGETDTLAVFGIMLIEGGGSGPDSTPAPLPGTVKAVTESTAWTAAIFGVDVETTYTEKTLSPDETLALNATAKLPITVDGTKRIKLTGKGREMEIKPGVAGTVTVDFAHASTTTEGTRTLSIVQNGTTVGSKGLGMGETGTATANVAAGSVTITCDAGVNVTSIMFVPEGGVAPVIPTAEPKPTQEPDTRTCVKITATYENGVLKDIEIVKDFKVADITTPENTDTTKTFYWESLESMKPVAAEAAPADPTEQPTEKPTPAPVDTSNVVVPETVVDVTNGVAWSADDFTAGESTETIIKDGLYIGADDSTDTAGKDTGAVVVDSAGSSPKTVEGTKYTQRIKTGGKGDPATGVRCFYFAVSDDCTLLLDAASSNSSTARDIVVIHGDTVEHLNVLAMAQYTVSGVKKDETVVIYSADGGLNVYGIKLTTGAAEGGQGGGTDAPSATAKQLPKDTLITFDAAAEGTGTTYTATTVFGDYLTIISNGSEMKLTANNKTIGGVDYASRLQLGSGGSGIFNKDGSPKTKAVSVTPAVDGTLTVAFASSSSDVSRAVAVKQGNSGTEHSETADGNGNTISVEVTAGTPVYIYSQSDAVNIYGIILE